MSIPKPTVHYKSHDELHKKKRKPLNRHVGFWLALLVIIILLAYVRLVFFKHHTKKAAPALPVVFDISTTANVPVYLNGLGAVTPTNTVTVKTQINGQLQAVYFEEGQTVQAGQLLAQIDPRPFEAQLLQNQGQLEHDQALLDNARIDLKRFQTLWKQNSVAEQVLATQIALVKEDEGTVITDQGLIAATKLNLIYCRIVSPVTGRIGLRLVDPGNYVQTTDTAGLFVIATQTPTTVVFTLPEDNIPEVMQQITAGKILPAYAYDRAQTTLLQTGQLYAVDSEIDPTTGTVKLKAQFQNSQNNLFPAQFVNIKLLVTTLLKAIVVPTAGIQNGGQGPYIFVLNADKKTVHMQSVTTGETVKDITVILKGINPGQTIVVEGADKLTEGSLVVAQAASTQPPQPAQPADPTTVATSSGINAERVTT